MTAAATRGPEFPRNPLPERFCNLDRLLADLERRNLDGVVVTSPLNVFYLSGFNGIAHKGDEPRPYAVVLSRHAADHPVMVLPDYYLNTLLRQRTWVQDVRPFRAVMSPMDRPPRRDDLDPYIPHDGAGVDWMRQARANYAFEYADQVKAAMKAVGLERGRVGFDDMGLGLRLGLEDVTVEDGYDPLMHARAVKTPAEMAMLERATLLNETAIRRITGQWQRGWTWRDLNHAYVMAVAELGGFVHDPGGLVLGHMPGDDPTLTLQTGLETGEIREGSHVMFDCHGTIDLYCWDGGKTWVVGGEPTADGRRRLDATRQVAGEMVQQMRAGAKVSALHAAGRAAYRKAGAADADGAFVFFHGLGLSHMDFETRTADGRPYRDWVLEEGMVIPVHLLLPGGERERSWLEEVVVVGRDGGRALFGWGHEPLLG